MADTISLVVAIHRFFGKMPNQTLEAFGKEIKALTPKDRAEMCEMLSKALDVVVVESV